MTFRELFIEGYKDDPRKLVAMKNSGTRGSGIDIDDIYQQKKSKREMKADNIRAYKDLRKDKAVKALEKNAKKLGLNFEWIFGNRDPYNPYASINITGDRGKGFKITMKYFDPSRSAEINNYCGRGDNCELDALDDKLENQETVFAAAAGFGKMLQANLKTYFRSMDATI